MTVEEIQVEISGRVGALINKMSSSVTAECNRLGCSAVVGNANGAKLVYPGRKKLTNFCISFVFSDSTLVER